MRQVAAPAMLSYLSAAGGDVKGLLEGGDGVADGALRWKLYSQIATGLDAIHRANLIHMDLKPENVLLTAEHDARIADLGMATFAEDDATATQTHAGGTRGYQAPEISTGKFSNKVDVWSLAVMFFEMAVGRIPDITTGALLAPLEARDEAFTLELLQSMLHLESQRRPSARAAGRISPSAR